MSRVVTFYSYKGGVGRTFALSNIGLLLAHHGKKVLLIDMDLEAPGLHKYFEPQLRDCTLAAKGAIQLFTEAAHNKNADWHPYVNEIKVTSPQSPGRPAEATVTLSLIHSGVLHQEYSSAVRNFSWSRFFDDQHGGEIVERWRTEWLEAYDFVLIDSRTGISDSGGVCTILLPDFLVLAFTANSQSLDGAVQIAQNAQFNRAHLPVERAQLTVLPLPGRLDMKQEVDLAKDWMDQFATKLKPFYDVWLPKPFFPMQILEKTKIPHVARFSFGEQLPVIDYSLTETELPGFYFENCSRLLESDFKEAGRIINPNLIEPEDLASQVSASARNTPFDEVQFYQLLQKAENELNEDALYDLLHKVALILHKHARFLIAERLLRRILVTTEARLGANHPEVGTILNNLTLLLQDTNRLAEAEPLIRRALAIDEANNAKGHSEVAVLNNLASVLKATGRLTEAEPLMRRVLDIEEAHFGKDHPSVAVSLSNLALLLYDTNRLTEAEPLLRRALKIDESSYDRNHPEIATDLGNLALLLQDTDRTDEAEPLIRRALSIDETSYGKDHPKVAVRLNNLAALLQNEERLTEAEPLMRRALIIDEANYGNNHPKVATRLNNLGGLLLQTNRLNEAEPLMRRGLLILYAFCNETGHVHPNLRIGLNNYITLCEQMNLEKDEIERRLKSIRTDAGMDSESFVKKHLSATASSNSVAKDS